jgi:ankyrin repeat protein
VKIISQQAILSNKLPYAAFEGNLKQCKALLDAGAEVNFPDHDGWAAIHGAVSGGHVKVCALLAKRGADLSAKAANNGRTLTPMQLAVYCEHVAVVDYFHTVHGEDLYQTTDGGQTLEALAREVAGGGREMIKHLMALRSAAVADVVYDALASGQGNEEGSHGVRAPVTKSCSL